MQVVIRRGLVAALFSAVTVSTAIASPGEGDHAQPSAVSPAPAVQRIEIRAAGAEPALRDARPEQVVAALGIGAVFDMSTGEELQLSPRGTGVRMKVGHRGAVTLQPKDGAFVSADGRLELRVSLDRFSEPAQARLTMPVGW